MKFVGHLGGSAVLIYGAIAIGLSGCGQFGIDRVASLDGKSASASGTPAPAPLVPPPPPATSSGLAAVVATGSTSCMYEAKNGTDLGDFVAPTFTQHNLRVTSPGCPVVVYFRSDASGGRDEVVFELGQFDGSSPSNFGPYAVTISKSGTVLNTTSIQNHFWFARWRWQSAPRPVTASVAALVGQGLLPSLDSSIGPKTGESFVPYEPMGFASVMSYMPTTGERDDIGWIPEWAARYLAFNSANALKQIFANADAAATFAWNIRDETGSPLSIDRHPDMALDRRFTSKPIASVQCDGSKAETLCPFSIDEAHQPQLTYVAYLLTQDPYYLEGLQFQANWQMLNGGTYDGLGLLINSQTRGFAWTLRNLAMAAAVVPDRVPSWLLPRSYFQRKLENNRRYMMALTVESAHPVIQAFNMPTFLPADLVAFWQNDFVTADYAHMVRMGFEQWKPMFEFAIKAVKARTSFSSGWDASHPSGYWMSLQATGIVPPLTWAELAAQNRSAGRLPAPAAVGTLASDEGHGYPSYVVGTLRLAASLGDAGAATNADWLLGQMGGTIPYLKWAYSKAATPAGPAQPLVVADPQFVNPNVVMPPGSAPFIMPAGTNFAIASEANQTVVAPFPYSFAKCYNYPSKPFIHCTNTHAGGWLATNARYVKFPDVVNPVDITGALPVN